MVKLEKSVFNLVWIPAEPICQWVCLFDIMCSSWWVDNARKVEIRLRWNRLEKRYLYLLENRVRQSVWLNLLELVHILLIIYRWCELKYWSSLKEGYRPWFSDILPRSQSDWLGEFRPGFLLNKVIWTRPLFTLCCQFRCHIHNWANRETYSLSPILDNLGNHVAIFEFKQLFLQQFHRCFKILLNPQFHFTFPQYYWVFQNCDFGLYSLTFARIDHSYVYYWNYLAYKSLNRDCCCTWISCILLFFYVWIILECQGRQRCGFFHKGWKKCWSLPKSGKGRCRKIENGSLRSFEKSKLENRALNL